MDTLLLDLRHAARSLVRSPGLAITAVVTLALGIGANTALFSLINGVFLAPPPGVGDSDGLLRPSYISTQYRDGRPVGISYVDYLALRDSTDVFADLSAYAHAEVAATVGDAPEQVGAELVTSDYFATLRLRPTLGRGFLEEENRTPGEHPVAVISHGLWQGRFAGTADVLERTVRVNGTDFDVVGVAPEGFIGLGGLFSPADVWLPLMMHEVARPGWEPFAEPAPGHRPLQAVGRLREDVAPDRGLAVMETLVRRMESAYPDAYGDASAGLFPLGGAGGDIGGELPLVIIAVGVTLVILLIACANLANLLLARAAARQKEIAIRAAVGASRRRILRQLLTESLVLTLIGGAAGVWVAMLMVDAFQAATPLPYLLPVSVDATTLLLTGGLSIITGIGVGLSPALRASKPDLTPALKDRVGLGNGRIRPQSILVAGQIALSFMLLVGAGLLIRSMWDILNVARTQPSREETIVVTLDLETANYSEAAQRELKERLLERLSGLPGVVAASAMSLRPPNWGPVMNPITRQGTTDATVDRLSRPRVLEHRVWPEFFQTTGLPLLRGRNLTTDEWSGGTSVTIVNETAARELWPGEEPLGQQLRVGSDTAAWTTVVGVVADAGFDRPRSTDSEPAIYTSELMRGPVGQLTGVLVRTRSEDRSIVNRLRRELAAIDPELPMLSVNSLGEHIDQKYMEGWVAGGLLAAFGGLAFLLALLGLHGVVSYTVVQRTREVGIRMSLGASRRQILQLFGKGVLRVAGTGLALGFFLAMAVALLLGSMLSWIRPADTLLFVAVALLLLAVSLVASYLPARRAIRVDPMVALRAES